MGYSMDELELLQKAEKKESAKIVRLAFREGVFTGLQRDDITSAKLDLLWSESQANASLDDDITIPLTYNNINTTQ